MTVRLCRELSSPRVSRAGSTSRGGEEAECMGTRPEAEDYFTDRRMSDGPMFGGDNRLGRLMSGQYNSLHALNQ